MEFITISQLNSNIFYKSISCDFLYYNRLKAAIPNKWVDEIYKASISEITNFETLPPFIIHVQE